MVCVDMGGSKGVYTAVVLVASPPPPSKPSQKLTEETERPRTTQTMLFLLVSVVLIAIVVEICFIYYFYKTKPSSEILWDQGIPQNDSKQDKQVTENSPVHLIPKTRPFFKPLAHLTAGSERPGMDGVMPWNNPINRELHQLKYRENKLVVEEEGYYYVYSKLCFNEDENVFNHLVMKTAIHYPNQNHIELLRYRYQRNGPKPLKKEAFVKNSYLGGVVHLFKGDAVFVLVRNGMVRLDTAGDNFFGMFMV